MEKIIKGDEVIVLAGKDKGKRGAVLARVNERQVLVADVNVVKKHQKPNPMRNQTGGVVDKTMPIDISNVGLFNAATGRADRVGVKVLEDGKKVRIFKSSGEQVPAKA